MLIPLVCAALAAAPVVTHRLDSEPVSPGAAAPPKVLVGTLSAPLTGELSKAVTEWANHSRELLGTPALVSFQHREAFSTRFGASFHLRQMVAGWPVHQAELVVTLGADARVRLISQTPVSVASLKTNKSVSGAEALASAALKVPGAAWKSAGVPYGGFRGELFQVAGGLHAGWWLWIPLADGVNSVYAAVDATDGALLFVESKVVHDANTGRVYPVSPGGVDGGVGVTPTVDLPLAHDDGGSMVLSGVDGGFLEGDRLTALNCCPTANCSGDVDAGPARAQGMLTYSGITVKYDTAICQRIQRASNDPAVHASGDFVYPPIDPPQEVNGKPVSVNSNDPADSDPFAEVSGFYHVNEIIDWASALSRTAAPIFPGNQPAIAGFQMDDEKKTPARKPAVWANVTFPNVFDISSITNPSCVLQGTVCVINALGRVDNAAFVPLEEMASLQVPAYMNDVDTLFLFQGDKSDFGYDGTVIWHESGHGVVFATSHLDPGGSLFLDPYSGNNEAGALHEGLADFISAAYGNSPVIGPYVGPRFAGGSGPLAKDASLRDLTGDFSCPSVLEGEVHQDSQHFSSALWKARTTVFAGNDNGKTFDTAIYASLVSMGPNENFLSTAMIMAAHLATAFPNVAGGADVAMNAIFDAKGVTNCTKVLDISDTLTREAYSIQNPTVAGLASSTQFPGPIQLKVHAPRGISSLTMTATPAASLIPLLPTMTTARLLARPNSPIVFNKQGNTLGSNATAHADFPMSGALTATVQPVVGCGEDVFLSIASSAGATLYDLKVQITPSPDCPDVDAGTDAGMSGTDGGSGHDGGTTDGGGTVMLPDGSHTDNKAQGCSCNAGEAGLLGLAAIAFALIRRRR